MASFFISHSSNDRQYAQQVHDWLTNREFPSVFLDFDPDDGIAGGQRWEQEIIVRLRWADALIFVSTPAASASKWCHAELVIARSAGTPIFPILFEGDEGPSLLADRQWIRPAPDGDPLGDLARALQQRDFRPLDTLEWYGTDPFPGLEPVDESRAGVFFGRQEEIRTSIKALTASTDPSSRVVPVLGPSGSGKSSVVRAGVIPRLRRLDPGWLVVPAILPGADPTGSLAGSLSQALGEAGSPRPPEACRERIDSPAGLTGLCAELRTAAGAPTAPVLIFIDQAEQLVTLADARAREQFVRILTAAVEADPQLRVVVTMLSDVLTPTLRETSLGPLLRRPITIGPLDRARLLEVIEKPALAAHVSLEEDLPQRMVDDAMRGGRTAIRSRDPLPLLAFTLQQLFRAPRSDPSRIDVADYEAAGRVDGALGLHADQVAGELKSRGLEPRTIPTLLRLVHLESGSDPTGQAVNLRDFDEGESQVIKAFRIARLLTEEAGQVRAAHEALFHSWRPLQVAIERDSDDLAERTRLEREARDWLSGEREPLGGAPLGRALEWRNRVRRAGGVVPSTLDRFLDASVRRRWWSRILRGGVSAPAVGLVVVLVVTAVLTMIRKQGAGGPMAHIAGGPTLLGTDQLGPRDPRVDFGLPTEIDLDAFSIDQFEVSNQRYKKCVEARACTEPTPGGPFTEPEDPDLPVRWVSAAQAYKFCDWLGRRLPTRAEWERAARGPKAETRAWPWGDEPPDPSKANVELSAYNLHDLSPATVDDPHYRVGATPEDDQIYHLIGNVWEWTSTSPQACSDPYRCLEPWDGTSGGGLYLAGLSFTYPLDPDTPALSYLFSQDATQASQDVGFRCARSDS